MIACRIPSRARPPADPTSARIRRTRSRPRVDRADRGDRDPQLPHLSRCDARPSAEAGYSEPLSTRGDNIALVAQYIYEHHRDRFDRVLAVISRRVPGVSSVEAVPTADGRLVLRFQDGSFRDPFLARYVSDGTIKMLAYLVLLYDPRPHPLLAVEEPENLAVANREHRKRGAEPS